MYKFFVFTILAVTLSQCEASDVFDRITRLKDTVNSVCNDLELYSNNSTSSLISELNDSKRTQKGIIYMAIPAAYKATLREVAALVVDRESAAFCYGEIMKEEIGDVQRTVYAELDKCVNDGILPFNAVKGTIDEHIKNGKLRLSELNGIVTSCQNSNQTQADLCAVQQLADNSSITNYEEMAKQLKSTVDALLESTPGLVTECFKKSMDDFYSILLEAISSTSKCLQSYQSNLPKLIY